MRAQTSRLFLLEDVGQAADTGGLTGSETSGGACPAARAAARPSSQYDRAADAPVPVSQYSVMLSTI